MYNINKLYNIKMYIVLIKIYVQPKQYKIMHKTYIKCVNIYNYHYTT